MGLFDIFSKKRTALDDFNDITKRAREKLNVPLICYKMAYNVLPKALLNDTDATLVRIQKNFNTYGLQNAGFPFFVDACVAHGCIAPDYSKSDAFGLVIGELTPAIVYYIFTYPKPEPVQTGKGLPILAPLCSALLIGKSNEELSYHVLGQSLDGGTMLRSVTADGTSIGLGSCDAPNLAAFIDLLKQRHLSQCTSRKRSIPAAQHERRALILRLYRHRCDTDPSIRQMAELTGQDPTDVPIEMLMTGSIEAGILSICEQHFDLVDQGFTEESAVRKLNEIHTLLLSQAGEHLPQLKYTPKLLHYLRHYVDSVHGHGAPVSDVFLVDAKWMVQKYYGR